MSYSIALYLFGSLAWFGRVSAALMGLHIVLAWLLYLRKDMFLGSAETREKNILRRSQQRPPLRGKAKAIPVLLIAAALLGIISAVIKV